MHYQLCPLPHRQVDQAFPLVQLAAPGLTLDRWRAYAAALVGAGNGHGHRPQPQGIVTAQDAKGYIHGLFCYAVQDDLSLGRALGVQHFVVGSLFDPRGVADTLLDCMESIARELECTAIHADLSRIQASPARCHDLFVERFESHGHRPDGVRFSKRLPRPGAAAG